MAIPFFILAGNFLTHGGVARRMINFASSMVGHWHGGLGLAGVMACALFAAVSGSSPATVVAIGSIILPAMVKQGFPTRFGAGVITTSGALGILIPPSIVMVMYAVATNTSVGAAVHRRHRSRPRARDDARAHDLVARAQEQLSAPAEGDAGRERLRAFRESVVGPAADRRRHRRHLHRHLHADRGGGDERGLRVLRRRVRLQGPAAARTCRRCCSTRRT